MYECLCAFAWMCVYILVYCVQKLFQVSLWILVHQFNLCWLHQIRGRLLAQASLKQRFHKAKCMKIICGW